jgi:hypothetical protein
VKSLTHAGVHSKDIAVLAPYAAQVSLLRDALLAEYLGVEVCTVDGVQGREKEAIIISLTRSNTSHTVGFLADRRRLNVAITRAKRHVCLIGDSETISSDPFLAALCDYCMNCPDVDYRSAANVSIDDQATTEGLNISPTKFPHPVKATKHVQYPNPPSMKRTDKSSIMRKNSNGVSQPASDLSLQQECNLACESLPESEKKFENEPGSFTDEMLTKILTDLLENQKIRSTYIFPDTLSAADRRRVHELAEKFGDAIEHYSENKKGRRRLVLAVRPNSSGGNEPSPQKQNMAKNLQKSSTTPTQEPIVDPKAARERAIDVMEKRAFGKLPAQNPIRFDSLKEDSAPESDSDNSPSPEQLCLPIPNVSRKNGQGLKPSRQGKKTKKSSKSETEDTLDSKDEEDLDDILAEFSIGVSKCPVSNCGASVRSMGFDCKYCHLRYCAKHLSPILHGCAGSAKADARAQMQQAFKDAQRSHSSKLLTSVQRDLLLQKVKLKAETARKSGEKEPKKKPR